MKLYLIKNFKNEAYMVRFSLFTILDISFKIHCFIASDDRGDNENPLFHSHPWNWWRTFILFGQYKECRPEGDFIRKAGYWGGGDGDTLHRVELIDNQLVLTLFITGKKHGRRWGFKCPKGIVDFKEFHDKGHCE